jgi:hypothetical protein
VFVFRAVEPEAERNNASRAGGGTTDLGILLDALLRRERLGLEGFVILHAAAPGHAKLRIQD